MTDPHAQHFAVQAFEPSGAAALGSRTSRTTQSKPSPVLIRSIQLPPLYSSPIILHPLLQFSPLSPIHYDLTRPTSTAVIHSSKRLSMAGLHYSGNWMNDPATFPSNICSITIRIPGIDRPIVIVSPTSSSTGEITVWDVLHACHRAWRQASEEIYTRHSNASPSNNFAYAPGSHPCPIHPPHHRVIHSTANRINAGWTANGPSHLGHASLWTGLTPSEEEQDVWVMNPNCYKRQM
ncbi:hypothetical protein CVT24_004610 [Panaeolus cyanescens]|uniref:DUF6699 domain-containing protein n=1 Tax=Panaeolus cyanescens TaxID=181874 RepID=A0A409YBF5_9AGAR|nr:hypothetical protein CVT24_004610 [Panaeolus cyanescens]